MIKVLTFFTICIIIGYINYGCNSMLQNKGQVNYNINIKTTEENNDRVQKVQRDDSSRTVNPERQIQEVSGYSGVSNQNKNGGKIMESNTIELLVSAIGSAITGVYVLVKTIINVFKTIKK